MAEQFWDSEELLGQDEKNDRGEILVVKKCTKKGKTFIDVRTFYPKGGEMAPGKGIAIPEDKINFVGDIINKIRGIGQ